MFKITAGGVHFEAWPSNLGQAFVVEPSGLSGWFDTPAAKLTTSERPQAHGAFDVPVFRSARSISVKGHVLAESETSLEAMKVQLAGLLLDGGGTLTVQTDKETTFARGVYQVSYRPGGWSGEEDSFQIQFVAQDPRRYGETDEKVRAQSGTSLNVFHRGNTTAAPELIITGTMPSGYRVNGPDGRAFVVAQALAAGQTHTIRMRDGALLRNGVRQIGGAVVTRAQTWGIPSGANVAMTLVPVSGSGSMRANVPATYF